MQETAITRNTNYKEEYKHTTNRRQYKKKNNHNEQYKNSTYREHLTKYQSKETNKIIKHILNNTKIQITRNNARNTNHKEQ